MSKQIRLGMLTPSSNTALEPITSAMVSGLPNVSAHFSRFTVTEISLRDQALCKQITEATGIPATTSVLALNEILEKTGARRFGLATPYLDDVQQRIIANYQRSGLDCSAERHLDLHVNYSFAEVEEDTIRTMVRALAKENVQAISTFCTNLHAAHLAEELEAETGIPLYDTISTVVWKSLRLAGVDTRTLKGWGRLFREVE